MVSNNYWDHNDKAGREPWRFIISTGYAYQKAGENLAFGFVSEQSTVTGWMNSEGHRRNMLDSNFSEVGFGTCVSENFVGAGKQLIVVQHFATPKTSSQSNNSQNTSQASSTPLPKAYMASVCTKTPIPYETVYVDAAYMYIGETQSYGGWDGYKQTCTADSNGYKPADYTSPPYNKTIYRGTKQKPVQSGTTSSPDYSRCNQFIGTGAYQACVNAINSSNR